MTQERDDLTFTAVSAFARFVYDHHLAEYIRFEIQHSRNTIPVWEKYKDIDDAAIFERSLEYYSEFLLAVAQNRTTENLTAILKLYKADLLDYATREQITPEDVVRTYAVRKKAFCHFLPLYTSDAQLMLQILQELDAILVLYTTRFTNAYIEVLNERMEEEKSIKEKLFHTSPGSYYIYDITTRSQVLQSERLFLALGYNIAEFDSNVAFFNEIMHPEDNLKAIDYIASLQNMTDGEVRFFEYRSKDAHGEYRWMRNYESVFKWTPEGKPMQLLGVAFDITDERASTEELRLKTEELLEAKRIAKISSYTWDIQNNILSSHLGNLENIGLHSGKSFEEVMSHVHPTDKKQVMEMFAKAIAGKREYEIEYRCTINGRERVLWSKGRIIHEDGRPRYLRATVMDVTEQQQMVRKLQRSEELYKQAQALNRIGNWSWEVNSDRVQWSDELYKIYDLAPQSEKITVDRYLSFIHPDDAHLRTDHVQEQLQNPVHHEYYFRIISARGVEKIIYGQSEVLLNEAGVPYKMIGTCQDVTTQKTLEKNLFDRTLQLQKSNASLKVFAYISSHDLKEPLRKISLFGDRLRMLNKDKLDEQSKNLLKTMIQSALRLQQMIDEILSVSRINAEDHFEVTDLTGILEDVVSNLEDELREQQAIIKYDALPKVYANPVQIRQLFTNLVSNSLKFAKPEVAPVITITSDFPAPAELTEMGLDNIVRHLRIRVADNGIGFQNEYAEKIFAIFQRLHDKSAYKGTGIGLAICREIVAHHKGIITAEGALQEGAVFTIVLPQSQGV